MGHIKNKVVIYNLTQTRVLQVHIGEKKMRDMYKHRNKQSARLAVLTANGEINETCREKWMDAKIGRRTNRRIQQPGTQIHVKNDMHGHHVDSDWFFPLFSSPQN